MKHGMGVVVIVCNVDIKCLKSIRQTSKNKIECFSSRSMFLLTLPNFLQFNDTALHTAALLFHLLLLFSFVPFSFFFSLNNLFFALFLVILC